MEPQLEQNPFILEEVTSWNAKIKVYSEETQLRYQKALTKMEEFLEILKEDSSEGYTIIIDEANTGLKCE